MIKMDKKDILTLLEKSERIVVNELKIKSKHTTLNEIRYYNSKTPTPRFGGKLSNNILYLNNNYNLTMLIEGILLRESLLKYIPQFYNNISSIADLGNEFARLNLKGEKKKYWTKMWKLNSKSFSDGYVVYDAPKYFPIYNKYTSNKFVPLIYHELIKFSNLCKSLDEVNYFRFIDEIINSSPPKLSPSELKILDHIDYNGKINAEKIHEKTQLALRTIFSSISKLKAKNIISEKTIYISQKFNMPVFYVIIQRKRSDQLPPHKLFIGNPFLWATWHIISNAGGIIAVFELYNRTTSLNEFNQMINKIKNKYNVYSFQRRSYRILTNLSIMNLENNRWHFNWAIWLKHAQLQSDIKLELEQFSIYITTMINKNHVKIANEIVNGNQEIAGIARALRLKQSDVRKMRRDLFDFGYLKDYTIINHLGLWDTVYILVRGPISEQKNALNGLITLPLTYVISDNSNSTLVRVKLPYGSSIKFGDMLRIFLQEFKDLTFSIYYVGRKIEYPRKLPVEYWDPIDQQFRHPESWSQWYQRFQEYISPYSY